MDVRESEFPRFRDKCYACDAKAIGVRDRRPEGGSIESACQRHADPTIPSYAACFMCDGPRPSLLIEGDFAHKSCHEAAVRGEDEEVPRAFR